MLVRILFFILQHPRTHTIATSRPVLFIAFVNTITPVRILFVCIKCFIFLNVNIVQIELPNVASLRFNEVILFRYCYVIILVEMYTYARAHTS